LTVLPVKPPITEQIVGDDPMAFLEDMIVVAIGVFALKFGWNAADNILPGARRRASSITQITEHGPGDVQETD
jgi:hypothetical protein